ncbi:hypothetical protein CONPUDRAFT_78412 [Coniophora puteana RWD-64-598 SS2]|uniref:DUF659 domain-containing protein n=1 Tax=Coniophora puteana (strain RWD-64-598) TaxID=741705 RepID=R7SFS1_CONPW|nr:uncharacterized protein CONPUDRAFT_78412 [Coniophora puteana RWD-64-598 SS2]EIW73939.1 hypothetical protein CONPUDRAFT_78412 [Coniophora puteana RWD-64-598 SS2]
MPQLLFYNDGKGYLQQNDLSSGPPIAPINQSSQPNLSVNTSSLSNPASRTGSPSLSVLGLLPAPGPSPSVLTENLSQPASPWGMHYTMPSLPSTSRPVSRTLTGVASGPLCPDIQVSDISKERKTADNFLRILEEVIKNVNESWVSQVIAVVTDASGESRKARQLLGIKFPSMIVLDCYAHQINLIVGNYFKSRSDLFVYTNLANKLISWLRGKIIFLALIKEFQKNTGESATAVIWAVLTRWTAHFMAYKRLLDLKFCLMQLSGAELACKDKKLIMTGDKKSREKAESMLWLIQDHPNTFWPAIQKVHDHLEPLAIAANITQAAQCHLYTVLLMFGYLIKKYRKLLSSDPEGNKACTAIISSIEAHWSRADQELFIAAIILNPLFVRKPFAPSTHLSVAGIIMLLERLYCRLFSCSSAPPGFSRQLMHNIFAFGTILTKLRASLGTVTLQGLAELKMMIRDKHRDKKLLAKQRLFQSMQEQTRDNYFLPISTFPPPSPIALDEAATPPFTELNSSEEPSSPQA